MNDHYAIILCSCYDLILLWNYSPNLSSRLNLNPNRRRTLIRTTMSKCGNIYTLKGRRHWISKSGMAVRNHRRYLRAVVLSVPLLLSQQIYTWLASRNFTTSPYLPTLTALTHDTHRHASLKTPSRLRIPWRFEGCMKFEMKMHSLSNRLTPRNPIQHHDSAQDWWLISLILLDWRMTSSAKIHLIRPLLILLWMIIWLCFVQLWMIIFNIWNSNQGGTSHWAMAIWLGNTSFLWCRTSILIHKKICFTLSIDGSHHGLTIGIKRSWSNSSLFSCSQITHQKQIWWTIDKTLDTKADGPRPLDVPIIVWCWIWKPR